METVSKKSAFKPIELAYIALGAALIAICAWITIPTTVPFTVTTTEVYARTDAQLKRKAIEAASKEIIPEEDAAWDYDLNLRDWLKRFNKV